MQKHAVTRFSWAEHVFVSVGFTVSSRLHWFLTVDQEALRPYDREPLKYAIGLARHLRQRHPNLTLIPFARWQVDELFAAVAENTSHTYAKGQVVIIDLSESQWPILNYYPSLSAWTADM